MNTEPPKIITEIDEKVERVNQLLNRSEKVIETDSQQSLGWEKFFVWIHENKIKKIGLFYQKQNGSPTYCEYYFDFDKLILIRKKKIKGYSQPSHFNGNYIIDSANEIYYYDYDELISKPNINIIGQDTLYVHVSYQETAYYLFKKYRYLQNYNPFKNIQYNRVVAYDYEGHGDRLIVDKNNKLDRSAILPGKQLTPQTQELLINNITDSLSYGGSVAGCFDPHLGIVFYMNDSITAHVSICFECNSLASSVYLPATVHNWQVDSGDDYYFVRPLTGFSRTGRKQLKQLCHQLGLSKCPEMDDGTIWD
ncbi:MAG TPA: hypothetical protein VEC12_05315 [Bacteroidia bacterium]|nr:hypothetical protein [Bacteroidia bacterium]